MRNAMLIALREIYQAVTTRGFWVGIFIFPLMGLLIFGVMRFSQTSASVKHFVLVDQTGRFDAVVDAGLELDYQRRVIESLQKYVRDNASASARDEAMQSLDDIPQSVIDDQQNITDAGIQQYIDNGGYQAALAAISSKLDADAPEFEPPKRLYPRVPLPPGIDAGDDLAGISEKLRPYLSGEKKLDVDGNQVSLFAAVLIPPRVHISSTYAPALAGLAGTQDDVQYWSTNLADDVLPKMLERLMTEEVRRNAFTAVGVAADVYRRIDDQEVKVRNFNPASEAGKEEVSLADRIEQWVPAGLTYFLWLSLFGILNALLTGTIEEKSNRIIEVLLSSVSADELMLGKLLGVATVGLIMSITQIALIIGILYGFSGPDAEFINQLLRVLVTSNLLPIFVAYYILGYIIYGGLFLTIGGLCDTITDAQSYMGPLMIIMMVPLFTLAIIPRDPHGTLAVAMSWFPLYTPFAMINRIAADPPMLEIIGTLVLLLATSALILWSTGKIFRIAILRSGQPPKLMELLRWVRGSEAMTQDTDNSI